MFYRICLTVTVFATMLFNCFSFTSYANTGKSSGEVKIQMTLSHAEASVNGQKMTLSTPPVLLNSTTMVPLRFIADALQADLVWHEADQSITLKYDDHSIQLSIENKKVIVDNETKLLDQPAVIMNSTTLVPLRFIAESFNQTVNFNETTKSISITTPHPKEKEIRIDNLNKPSDMKFRFDMRMVSMASDHHGKIYMIKKFDESDARFEIYVYNEATGETDLAYGGFYESFNFDYMDPNLGKQQFNASLLTARKLVYDSNLDKLYVVAYSNFISESSVSSVIYELAPHVQMMTYTIGSMIYHPGNFMVTPDGQQFYFSDITHDKIYKGNAGQQAKTFMSYTPEKENVKLAAVANEGKVFLLDVNKKTINELKDTASLTYIAPLDIKEEIQRVYEDNGTFYVEGNTQIWETKVTGETRPYVGLKDVASYNQGMYLPKTNTYKVDEYLNLALTPGMKPMLKFGVFAINEEGNPVIFDVTNYLLRRINLYTR